MWIPLSLLGLAVTALFPVPTAGAEPILAFVGAALALGGGLLGGIAGAAGNKQESTSGLNMGAASGLENSAGGGLSKDYASLRSMFDQGGPNAGDYSKGTQAQRDFAAMLGQYSKSGGLPGQGDLDTANVFAQRAFDPQRVQMQQGFEDQKVEASRLSASLGRSVDDPILQAKLRSEMMRQQSSLGAQQGAFANQMALQLPGQRLGYAGQQAGVLDDIGQRASANRQLLMSLGSQILGNERAFRMNTAERWGEQKSGGGIEGAMNGALGGMGAGMSMFSAGQGAGMWGGGGGGGFSSPIAQQAGMVQMPQMPSFGSSMSRASAPSPFSFTPRQYGLGANTNLGY